MDSLEEILTRGVEEVIEKKSLERKLKSKKGLRIKYGVDPTAPDIHLGIAAILRKLAKLQKLGHHIIFLIGDFTATIGDPSGAKKTRPMLSEAEVRHNAKTYTDQASKILDINKTEIRYNSEWYKKLSLVDFLKIKSNFTLQRILERDDFTERLKSNKEIRMHEIDYPILQGYDSVMLKADLEIGGSDQKFNMLAGRKLMEKFNLPPQDVITVKILVGTDGVKKMSKSVGNYIGITEEPDQMYGKIMSLPDELILPYFELCTDVGLDEVKKIKNPLDQKMRLAFEIVKIYHNKEEAEKAEREFIRVFRKKEVPSKVESKFVKSRNIVDILVEANLVSSKSEAKRLIAQGGVEFKIGNQKIKVHDIKENVPIEKNPIIQVGKRRFVQLKEYRGG